MQIDYQGNAQSVGANLSCSCYCISVLTYAIMVPLLNEGTLDVELMHFGQCSAIVLKPLNDVQSMNSLSISNKTSLSQMHGVVQQCIQYVY